MPLEEKLHTVPILMLKVKFQSFLVDQIENSHKLRKGDLYFGVAVLIWVFKIYFHYRYVQKKTSSGIKEDTSSTPSKSVKFAEPQSSTKPSTSTAYSSNSSSSHDSTSTESPSYISGFGSKAAAEARAAVSSNTSYSK